MAEAPGGGQPRLFVTDEGDPASDPAWIERVVAAALERGARPDAEVSLLLTDDAEIARVHGEYLGDPTPTDVISFELDDTIDLVVSVECAVRRATAAGSEVAAEVALYVVHGILHACGFDDHEAADRARMRAAERDVLRVLGVTVAPVDAD